MSGAFSPRGRAEADGVELADARARPAELHELARPRVRMPGDEMPAATTAALTRETHEAMKHRTFRLRGPDLEQSRADFAL